MINKITLRNWIFGTVIASGLTAGVAYDIDHPRVHLSHEGAEILGISKDETQKPLWKWDGETLWLSEAALKTLVPDGDGGAWLIP